MDRRSPAAGRGPAGVPGVPGAGGGEQRAGRGVQPGQRYLDGALGGGLDAPRPALGGGLFCVRAIYRLSVTCICPA